MQEVLAAIVNNPQLLSTPLINRINVRYSLVGNTSQECQRITCLLE